jgi:hypothetical protein
MHSSGAKMCSLPPKFNQICRLCLTVVESKDSDAIAEQLSIFNRARQPQRRNDKKSNQITDDVRDDDQLNKKAKRSNEISISLSGGGSASVINNGFSSSDVVDTDSDVDISKRILQCLSLKVSQPKSGSRKCLFAVSPLAQWGEDRKRASSRILITMSLSVAIN